MQTIVVPSDLSADTEMALSVAVDIARTHRSTILLLHSVVYPLPMPSYTETGPILDTHLADEYRNAEDEAHKALKTFIDNENYKGVTIIPTLISHGEGLVHDITDQPADLIVMSSKGSSGVGEWLVGSNAESVVRYAHCPVLVIKHPIAHFQPDNVVCAIDIDERLKAVQHYPFQLGEQGLHQFLYVMTPTDGRIPDGIRDWVNEFTRAKGITEFDFALRRAPSVPEGIIAYADEVKADLIVLYTHGHKGLRHLLSGSVAEDVLNRCPMPVLIMRAAPKE